VKREPFVPPVREPLFDPGAEDSPAAAAVEAAGEQSCGAAVPAAEPAIVTAESSAESSSQTAELPITHSESPADNSAPAVEVPNSPTEGSPDPEPAAEPGGTQSELETAPQDDFGAGLGDG